MSRPTQFYPPILNRKRMAGEEDLKPFKYVYYVLSFAYSIEIIAFISLRMPETISL